MRDTRLEIKSVEIDLSYPEEIEFYQLYTYDPNAAPEFRYFLLMFTMHEREAIEYKNKWDLHGDQEFRIFKTKLPIGARS